MFEIVAAGVLGSAAVIVVVLYRRIEDLDRQVSDLRVERASEDVINTLLGAPHANGNGDGGPPEPVRRRGHLGLYVSGVAAALAALGSGIRGTWRNHPWTASGVTVGVGVIVTGLLFFTVWQDGGGRMTPPAATPTSATAPRMTPSPSRAEDASPTPPTPPPGEATFLPSGTAPGPGEVPLAQSSPSPVPSGQIPSSDTTPGPGATTPPADPSPTGTERPDTATPTPPPPDRRGLCLHVAARPVLDLDACLPLGR